MSMSFFLVQNKDVFVVAQVEKHALGSSVRLNPDCPTRVK